MKRESALAIGAGILLVLLALLVIEVIFYPGGIAIYLIPLGVFVVALWLNAYRVARKKTG